MFAIIKEPEGLRGLGFFGERHPSGIAGGYLDGGFSLDLPP